MYGTSSVVMRALRAGRRGGGLCGELGERLGRELLGVLGTHLMKILVRLRCGFGFGFGFGIGFELPCNKHD